jgi:hypothetical protein
MANEKKIKDAELACQRVAFKLGLLAKAWEVRTALPLMPLFALSDNAKSLAARPPARPPP